MSDTSPILVRVEHKFQTSPERVFDAWLDSAMIGRFMFGPALREEEVLRIQFDARVGGAFSFLVRRGGQEIDHVGNYLEIDRPRRLVFTWGTADTLPETSRVMIDIVSAKSAAGESETRLTLTHEMARKWADYADRVQSGWTKMVAALGGIVDNG
jgi:uncharacterized protein YndB with AHSA1/START domain